MVVGVLLCTSGAASAKIRASTLTISGTVTCSLSGTLHFSPPLRASGGGTGASRLSATLTSCSTTAANVKAISSTHLAGEFTSSPFTCFSGSQTDALLSAVIKWRGTASPRGKIPSTTVENGVSSGSFAGSAVASLEVPITISLPYGCTGALKSVAVAGSIVVGQPPPFTLYPIEPPASTKPGYMPTNMTTGSDGALWFTTYDDGLIGRMTTSGVTTFYPAPIGSEGTWGNGAITAGSDGALWFLADSGSAIGRMTTSGSVTTYPLPTGIGMASAITSGPDGNLWFTVYNYSGGANSIGQLTTSGQFTIYTDPSLGTGDWNSLSHRALPDITSGPGGTLWFSCEYASNVVGPGAASIGEITTAGVITSYTIPFDATPGPLVAGPDGAIWFAGADDSGVRGIGRVTTSGQFSAYPGAPGQVGQVLGITAGPDGDLWFTNYSVPGDTGYFPYPEIDRITTAGVITAYSDPYVKGAMGITLGPDGAVWFEDHLNDTIGRVDIP
jgi:virginiamycin B lyase